MADPLNGERLSVGSVDPKELGKQQSRLSEQLAALDRAAAQLAALQALEEINALAAQQQLDAKREAQETARVAQEADRAAAREAAATVLTDCRRLFSVSGNIIVVLSLSSLRPDNEQSQLANLSDHRSSHR